MRVLLFTLIIFALAACGGRSYRASQGVEVARGPISEACLSSGRSSASRALCGCIQGVANAELNASDQRRGAGFFGNPERAHAVRLDDSPSADAFWARWTGFASRAENVCRSAL